MKKGSEKLSDKQRDKAILIMGVSGAGKSTLCSLFGKFKLIAKVDDEIGDIVIEHFSNPQEKLEDKITPP